MPRLTNSGKVPDLPRKAFFMEHHMVHLASLPIRTAYLGSHTKKAGGSLAVALCWALRQVSVIRYTFLLQIGLISKKGATSRRGLKRLQSCIRVEEDRSTGSCDESLKSNLSTDESLEFSDLVSSFKFANNRPPLADVIERPKSSLPTTRGSPLAVSLTPFLWVFTSRV